jgi:hypothetical protein
MDAPELIMRGVELYALFSILSVLRRWETANEQ